MLNKNEKKRSDICFKPKVISSKCTFAYISNIAARMNCRYSIVIQLLQQLLKRKQQLKY